MKEVQSAQNTGSVTATWLRPIRAFPKPVADNPSVFCHQGWRGVPLWPSRPFCTLLRAFSVKPSVCSLSSSRRSHLDLPGSGGNISEEGLLATLQGSGAPGTVIPCYLSLSACFSARPLLHHSWDVHPVSCLLLRCRKCAQRYVI